MNLLRLALIGVVSFSFVTLADHHEKGSMKPEKIEKVKAKMTENIQKRIDTLTNLKTCVNSAEDRMALKTCRKTHKKKMKSLKSEMKHMRKNHKKHKKN